MWFRHKFDELYNVSAWFTLIMGLLIFTIGFVLFIIGDAIYLVSSWSVGRIWNWVKRFKLSISSKI